MHELLSDEGYAVTVLRAQDHAYQQIKPAAPDLVILDMTLEDPGSGWPVLEMLKLDPETAKTPVIVCSADTLLIRQRREQIEELGCYVVEKPFDLDILLSTVRSALASPQPFLTQN